MIKLTQPKILINTYFYHLNNKEGLINRATLIFAI